VPENDFGLGALTVKDEVPNLKDFDQRLRDEAAAEPTLEVPQGEPTSKTQIIAIYGKGGIGKSFTLANLSHMMAEQGKRVLLIGCDPKSDTTSLLFGGKACPTIIETSTRKKLAGEEVKIGDVCFKRGGVFAMELGGPEVGRGCGGRGIIHGFELLEKLGFHDWDFDYVLLDFLGDVVCGGFGLPIARDMAQKVILVASNDLQSLYVANNVCSAVEYFRKLGGNVGVAGLVINKDDGSGEAAAFAEAVKIPVLASIPQNDDLRKKSANYQIVGTAQSEWGALFAMLGDNVAVAPPVRPTPLGPDALLDLFDASETGGDYKLVPATDIDMRGKNAAPKASLEVVYDDA
jgi:chlorophyllide a reductase subunit X